MWFWSKNFDPSTDVPDLTEEVAIVTGANAGQGFHIAEYLALNGAKVYVGARSEAKAKSALDKFHALHPDHKGPGELVYLQLDLVDPRNAAAAAKEVLENETRLDFLSKLLSVWLCPDTDILAVNNATGPPTTKYALTPDGIETLVSINHIGHFVLTTKLLPLLQRTASLPGSDVRIVTVSSAAHTIIKDASFSSKEVFQSSQAKPGDANVDFLLTASTRYAYTKFFNVLFANKLQRLLLADVPLGTNPIISISLNPGTVGTEGAIALFPAILRKPLSWISATPTDGAAAALFASTARVVREQTETYQGSYLDRGGVLSESSKLTKDPRLMEEMWELTEQVVAEALAESK